MKQKINLDSAVAIENAAKLTKILKNFGEEQSRENKDQIKDFLAKNPPIDWNYKDDKGNSVLHNVVILSDSNLVQIILKQNPPEDAIQARNDDGKSVFEIADENELQEIYDLLENYQPVQARPVNNGKHFVLVGSDIDTKKINPSVEKSGAELLMFGKPEEYITALQALENYTAKEVKISVVGHGGKDGTIYINGQTQIDILVKNLVAANKASQGFIDFHACYISKDVLAKKPENDKQNMVAAALPNGWVLCLSGGKERVLATFDDKSTSQSLLGFNKSSQNLSVFRILAEKSFLAKTFKICLKSGEQARWEKFASLKPDEFSAELQHKLLSDKDAFFDEYKKHILGHINKLEEVFLEHYKDNEEQQNQVKTEAENIKKYLEENIEIIVEGYVNDHFLRAVDEAKEERVKFYVNNSALLKSLAGLNIEEQYGDSTLLWVCVSGNLEVFNILKNAGVVNNNLEESLFLACQHGHIEMAKILLKDKNFDINKKFDNGYSAVFISLIKGHYQIFEFLLEQERIDIEAKDNSGRSVLHIACGQDIYESCLELLLSKGADLKSLDKNGHSPLYVALFESNNPSKIIHTLLKNVSNRDNVITSLGEEIDKKFSGSDKRSNNSKLQLYDMIRDIVAGLEFVDVEPEQEQPASSVRADGKNRNARSSVVAGNNRKKCDPCVIL